MQRTLEIGTNRKDGGYIIISKEADWKMVDKSKHLCNIYLGSVDRVCIERGYSRDEMQTRKSASVATTRGKLRKLIGEL